MGLLGRRLGAYMRQMLVRLRRGPVAVTLVLLIVVVLLGADSFSQLTSRAAGVADLTGPPTIPALTTIRSVVVASKDVPAHTSITDSPTLSSYFKDVLVPSQSVVPT